MTSTWTPLRARLPVAERALEPRFGRALAERWVQEHRAGRSVAGTRAHTAYYRGAGELSLRVDVTFAPAEGPGDQLTLLVRCDSSGGTTATAFPDDPELPTLEGLLRPDAPPALASLGLAGAAGAGEVAVVHHPRTGACVLRIGVAEQRHVFAKVYPSRAEATAAAAVLDALGHREEPGRGGPVRLPRLLGLDPARHLTVLESVAPVPAVDNPRPVSLLEAGQALATLHRRPPVGPLPVVGPLDGADEVARESALTATAWPELAAALAAPLARARRALAAHDPGRPVLSHGDFTPGQLVRRRDGLGLIDLDTLRLAEPAADLGRYLAYAELAALRRGSRHPRPGGATAELLVGYGRPGSGHPDLRARTLAYRELTLVHVALHAARRFKDRRVSHALSLLAQPHTTEGVAS